MDESDNQNNNTTKRLVIDDSNCFDAQLPTGEEIKVHKTSIRPLVDCHMHIQSLHATPMPLQWGAAYFKASFLGKMYGKGRSEMTKTLAMLLDLGKIGRLSTDLIAKLYMNDIKNGDFKKKLHWTLPYREVELPPRHERAPDDRTVEKEPILPNLEVLSLERERLLQDFYKAADYYYGGNEVLNLAFVMPMDLSFAHFWGAHGLPINLPVPGDNTFYHIDDLHHIRCTTTRLTKVERRYEPYNNPYEPNITNDQISHHLSYCFDFQKELENYINYIGYREGLTGYSSPSRENAFYILFDHDSLVEKLAAKAVAEDKKVILEKHRADFIKQLTYDNKKVQRRQRYMHYLKETPGDNSELFEDYYLQLAYTESSAYRYPLQLIPFYHYDPRRYYTDERWLDQFAAEIAKRHLYYRLTQKRCSLEGAEPELRSRLEFSIIKDDKSEQELLNKDYYQKMFYDRYKTNSKGKEKKVGSGTMKKNNYAIDRLFPNGCFLGVKMYPALGYPPDLYNREKHGHEEGDYYSEQFSGLKELYQYCVDKNIPVLAHCCPLGMTIADGYNYEIRDERKEKKESWQPRDYHDVKKSALYMDDIGGHPRNWARVLSDFPDLKLCLAHFAGQDVWENKKKAKQEKGIDDWRCELIRLIDNYDNVYTDLAYFSLGFNPIPDQIEGSIWRNKIEKNLEQSYIQVLERYYIRRRSTFYLQRHPNRDDEAIIRAVLRKAGVLNGSMTKIAKNLAAAIKIYPKLKGRIMMGTDWYMLEADKKGTGPYYARLFELLVQVSKELDEKFDAWHQFSVVNPLQFIGFLKEKSSGVLMKKNVKGKAAYVLNIERIERYIDNLKKLPKSMLKQCDVKQHEIDNFENNVANKLNQLKNSTIYTAESMTNSDGKLIILHGK